MYRLNVLTYLIGCYATHFLKFNGKHLHDEGIDGEVRKTNFLSFNEWYLNGI